MKLSEYQLRGWHYNDISERLPIGEIEIIILKVNLNELGFKGRLHNLVAIDNHENILWAANIPKAYSSEDVFTDVKYENNKLYAWRGNLYMEIDISNGKVINWSEIR
jgi:hypothetical protein